MSLRGLLLLVVAALFGVEVMFLVTAIERGDRIMVAWSSALAAIFLAYVFAEVLDRLLRTITWRTETQTQTTGTANWVHRPWTGDHITDDDIERD